LKLWASLFFGTGSMRSHLLAAVTLATSALWAASAQAAVTITIDKSMQQMVVEVDGRPLYNWPVSTGKANGYDTPGGKFKAFRMEKEHFSKEFDDAPMPNSIFFTQKGHAIHGSYDVKHLGTPASHGCVRLLPANAAKLYALVEKEGVTNTTVILTGVAPSSAPAVARRTLPRQNDLDAQQYAQPQYGQQQYGQQQYSQQQYVQPLPRPVYGTPYYGQPQYTQPQYAQPQYAQPRPYYRDPYQDPYQARPRTLFPFN